MWNEKEYENNIVYNSGDFNSSIDCQGSSQCTQVENDPPCVCSLNGKNIDLRSLAKNDNTA